MLEFIKAGGWIMAPIILCSVLALAIVLERFWTLRRSKVIPADIPGKVEAWANTDDLDYSHLAALRKSSPLGEILAAALINRHRSRDILKEAVEESGRHVVHEMQRFLNTLGTIADITPLLGLL
ncbi:MAG: MotA/TolQ/ExbB proton channel family protein, partial [Xanthomonadales bacterium]|nr:MotA/TolQ/ExbB proton channel family protein [Xanthomonadales bacterium]